MTIAEKIAFIHETIGVHPLDINACCEPIRQGMYQEGDTPSLPFGSLFTDDPHLPSGIVRLRVGTDNEWINIVYEVAEAVKNTREEEENYTDVLYDCLYWKRPILVLDDQVLNRYCLFPPSKSTLDAFAHSIYGLVDGYLDRYALSSIVDLCGSVSLVTSLDQDNIHDLGKALQQLIGNWNLIPSMSPEEVAEVIVRKTKETNVPVIWITKEKSSEAEDILLNAKVECAVFVVEGDLDRTTVGDITWYAMQGNETVFHG